MGLLLLLAAGALVWAWSTGRLRGFTYEDMAAGFVFLLGLRFLTTGRLIPGAALMGGSLLWAAWRRPRPAAPTMPVDDARRLLGVREGATLAEIRDAHRRLIARVHPDAGGSAELARRVNVARDTLVAEMNRRTPRAS
ncbi:MAG: molecular chaperone DnaJ [Alphaproteobacteria bacterium]|nr:molecular chaperone DnaJ [Alphaproteobacteria bacterium]MBV9371803.1 molecular chaperone DnaJ [Alphaproteobacteria bacterium]MBV9901912.1 molecular chaperone DnaJ [Alphaproteobacteria bacterium]